MALLLFPLWAGAQNQDGQEPLVVGGSVASVDDHGYLGVVSVSSDRGDEAFCGSTYIGDQWALTAAHCLQDLSCSEIEDSLQVLYYYRNPQEDSDQPYQKIKADRAYVHPNYLGHLRSPEEAEEDPDVRYVLYDIALIHLESAPTNVPAMELIEDNADVGAGAIMTVVGRGAHGQRLIAEDEEYESFCEQSPGICNLHTANIPVEDSGSENGCFKPFGFTPRGDLAICAGDLIQKIDACPGDSGGPLLHTNMDSQTQVHGVVNWGSTHCGSATTTAGYARVSAFKSWILNQQRAPWNEPSLTAQQQSAIPCPVYFQAIDEPVVEEPDDPHPELQSSGCVLRNTRASAAVDPILVLFLFSSLILLRRRTKAQRQA